MRVAVKWLHRRQALTAVLLLASLAVLAACQPVQMPAAGGGSTTEATVEATAEATAEATTEAGAGAIPEVVVSVDDTQVTVPDDFPGGIVHVTVQNNSSKDLDIGFGRVKEGHTAEEIETLNADFDANMMPLINAVSFMMGFNPVPAGEARDAYIDFRTGEFMVDATEHSEESAPPGQPHLYGVFKADKLVGTTEPQADVKVEMQDFAFVMPDEIKAGKLLWEYDNTGTQWHMQFLIKPDADASMEDVMAAMTTLMQGGELSGPPPFEDVPDVGVPPLGPGERTWMEVSLEPGTYIAVCPLPDLAAMASGDQPMPHAAKGMERTLTVK